MAALPAQLARHLHRLFVAQILIAVVVVCTAIWFKSPVFYFAVMGGCLVSIGFRIREQRLSKFPDCNGSTSYRDNFCKHCGNNLAE